MSVRVQASIWKNSKHGGSPLLLLLAIGDFADDHGVAHPSVRTLAEKTKLSERGVQYLIHRLIQSGELKIERGAGPKGCNLFRVQFVQGCKHGAPVQTVQGESQRSEGVQKEGVSERKKESNTKKERKEPPENHQASGLRPLDEAFETFVAVFGELRAPAKYSRTDVAGFVQLADLRKRQGIEALRAPPDWLKACRNYCASPLGKFSLADLCTRYAVFVHSGVNEYGKPIRSNPARHGSDKENPNTRAAKDFVSRELAKTLLADVSDVREDALGFPGEIRDVSRRPGE